MAEINERDWFIVNGQKAYIAEVSKERIHGFDKNDYRLRVIFDNKTESDLLLRSMQKALYVDDASRRIVSLSAGPLFDGNAEDEDTASGTIYVLRSKSEHPTIVENRNLIHKIGVTGGSVKTRIASAKLDPTYLMADVEIVATYELYNISRTKLENILHRFFESAKLDIQINDRFGNPVIPREWFLVPLFIVDEVVEKIKDGTISEYCYDTKKRQASVGLKHFCLNLKTERMIVWNQYFSIFIYILQQILKSRMEITTWLNQRTSHFQQLKASILDSAFKGEL